MFTFSLGLLLKSNRFSFGKTLSSSFVRSSASSTETNETLGSTYLYLDEAATEISVSLNGFKVTERQLEKICNQIGVKPFVMPYGGRKAIRKADFISNFSIFVEKSVNDSSKHSAHRVRGALTYSEKKCAFLSFIQYTIESPDFEWFTILMYLKNYNTDTFADWEKSDVVEFLKQSLPGPKKVTFEEEEVLGIPRKLTPKERGDKAKAALRAFLEKNRSEDINESLDVIDSAIRDSSNE